VLIPVVGVVLVVELVLRNIAAQRSCNDLAPDCSVSCRTGSRPSTGISRVFLAGVLLLYRCRCCVQGLRHVVYDEATHRQAVSQSEADHRNAVLLRYDFTLQSLSKEFRLLLEQEQLWRQGSNTQRELCISHTRNTSHGR